MSLESIINPFARILSDGGALMLPLVASAALLWGAMGARAVLLWLGLVPPTGAFYIVRVGEALRLLGFQIDAPFFF